MKETFYDIFRQLNATPRPSHHEERVADFLCNFAEKHGLRYRRDAQNCVVIEKDATPGYENAEPVVILNHMDMVCVAKDGYLRDGHKFDPLNDEIRPYIETITNEDGTTTRWMKAEGTSLGADNGMGLSMALAVLADDSIVHGPLEVLTTTNEEDGMSGAEGLSSDFIKGRKVINLDSEAYDEITVGAAGAYLQIGHWTIDRQPLPAGLKCMKIVIDGGLGGHSGVDINKGRCNTNKSLFGMLSVDCFGNDKAPMFYVCSMNGGTANASIASAAEAIIAINPDDIDWWKQQIDTYYINTRARVADTDSGINVRLEDAEQQTSYIANASNICKAIADIPFGVIEMRKDMPGTVMTSNNIGMVCTKDDEITVSCHSRSFSNDDQLKLGESIRDIMNENGCSTIELLMNTGAWMEREDSPLLKLTCDTFSDVLGFEPKKVAMHFVLEAAYYVEKYPGVEIASIGPLIIEPHSTSERVNLDTADNIWKVTIELLRRLAVV